MSSGIGSHIENFDLEMGERVNLSLIAEESIYQPSIKGLKYFNFKLSVSKENGEEYRPLLATVTSAQEVKTLYGERNENLSQLVEALQDQQILPKGKSKLLEPFCETPQLRLEESMSTDSALYIFSGLVEYVRAIKEIISDDQGDYKLNIAGKKIDDNFFEAVEGCQLVTFQGYKDRTMDDRELLRSA
jgi:hypothetical protein